MALDDFLWVEMIKGVAKVAVLEFVCFYIFNLSIIFLNFILIVFFLNYLGDSAAADRAFATRFFLSYLVFVFQFKHKTKRRQRSNNPEASGQSLSQIHTIPSTILLLITVFHIESHIIFGTIEGII